MARKLHPSPHMNKSDLKRSTSYLYLLCLIILFGCGPDQDFNTEYGLNNSMGNNGRENLFLLELMQSNEKAPGWPSYPRRWASISNDTKIDTTLSFGVKGSFFGLVEGEATQSFNFGVGHGSNLLLVKTSEGGRNTLTKRIGNTIYLNYEEGIDFVGMCTYKSYLNTGSHSVGSLTFMGNGISSNIGLEQSTEVYQGTNFFHITQDDTVKQILRKCEKVFSRNIKRSIAKDLKNTVLSQIQIDHNKEDLALAIKSALGGPKRNRLNIYGHHWDVEPISWYIPRGTRNTANSEKFYLKGRISRNNRWMGGRQQVEYEYRFNGEKVVRQSIREIHNGRIRTLDRDAAWKEAAHRLIANIVDEAQLRFRYSFKDLEPGQKEHVILYTHKNHQGQSFRFGLGHYNRFYLDNFKNDAITSIRVPKGLKATLYEHTNFHGRKWVYKGGSNVAWIGHNANDKITSFKIERDSNHIRYYKIINRKTRRCLGANNGSREESLDITQDRCRALNSQYFGLKYINDGYFQILIRHSGKCLSIDEATDAVVQKSCREVDQHLWAIEHIGSGYYEIINKNNSKLLSLESLENLVEAKPILKEALDKPIQYWSFDRVAIHKRYLTPKQEAPQRIRNKHSQMCLKSSSGRIIQANCRYTNSMRFILERQSYDYYMIKLASNPSRCLDIEGASKDKKAAIISSRCNSQRTQMFKLIDYHQDGYYKLMSKHSGKCLDVEGGSRNSGARLIQWHCYGNLGKNKKNQLFHIPVF